jgi:hypothetical protein
MRDLESRLLAPVPPGGQEGSFMLVETGSDRSMILRSLPIVVAILIGDFALFNLLPGVDIGPQRTVRYAPYIALAGLSFLVGMILVWRSPRKPPRPGRAELAVSPAPSRLVRLYAAGLVVGLVGSILFAYLVGKALVFRLDHETVWKDTITYATVAEAPLWSSQFWAGERSFTLPLIYKILGISRTTLSQVPQLRPISSLQFVLGFLSWTLLAGVTGSLVRSRWLQPIGMGVILALALTLDVSLWDRIPLSESVSASLLALLVSLAILGIKNRDRLGLHGGGWQIPYWIALCAVSVLYSFTRDTNAYFLAACGLAILGAISFTGIRRHPSLPVWTIFSVFLLALAVVQSRTADRGDRWLLPYLNILNTRIYPDEDARGFFLDAGMPADERTAEILDRNRRRFLEEVQFNYAAQPLIDWVETNGRSTYLRYLLSRPVPTLMRPINRAHNLISPLSTEYRTDVYSVPVWLDYFSRAFFPRPLGIVVGWMVVALALTVVLGRMRRLRPEWLVPGLLVLTAFPMMYVVWYGDAIEVERHAFQISLQVRLGLWMLTVLLADAWLAPSTPSSAQGIPRPELLSLRSGPGG